MPTRDKLKLIILVDMDDTIENLCEVWVQTLNETHGTNVKLDDITDWDITKPFPMLTHEQIFAPLSSERLWQKVTPLPGAVECLKRLIDDGHKVIIVTASNPSTVALKLNNVLFKYFPFITPENVIVTSRKQLIRGDILIDDAPHNLEGGEYLGLLFDAPHNRGYDEGQHGIIRVKDWETIYKTISDYASFLSILRG